MRSRIFKIVPQLNETTVSQVLQEKFCKAKQDWFGAHNSEV